MVTTYRHVLGAAAIAIASFATSQAFAAEYRLGHGYPVGSSVANAADLFAAQVKERTNGEVEIVVFPARQIGTDEQMMRDLSRGLLDFSFANFVTATGLEPRLDVGMLPYLTTNYEQVDRVFYGDGALPTMIKDLLAGMRIHHLAWFEQEFRAVANSKHPLKTVEDFAGLKVRVPAVRVLTSFFDAVGVQTISMSVTEMYTALQQKAVDGQENGPMQTYDAKLHESTPYMTLTNHAFVTGGILMSEALSQQLGAETVAVITEVAAEVQASQIKETRERVADAVEKLRADGVDVIELPEAEMARLQEIGMSVWPNLADTYGAELIEALRQEALGQQ